MPKAEKSANSHHRKLKTVMLLVLACLGPSIFLLSRLLQYDGRADLSFGHILSGYSGDMDSWLPSWSIGAIFYSVLILSIYRMQAFTAPIVFGALGFSLGLILQKAASPIVLVNLFVLISIGALTFEKNKTPQLVLTLLLLFVAAFFHGRSAPTAVTPPTGVVAEAAGGAILLEDLDAPLAMRIHDLEESIYQLRKQRLDQMIDKIVLQKEAERNKESVQQLLDKEVLSKGVEVTDKEIEQYYDENRQKWSQSTKSKEELRGEIANLVANRKGYEKVMDFAASLYAHYGVNVYLKEPAPPTLHTKFEGGVSRGPHNAPITVVEFSDYQCPACKQSHQAVKTVQSVYSDKLLWVFKDFPLHRDEASLQAAQAARCADEQGKFWDYQDSLFSHVGEPSPDRLVGYARELGLNTEVFENCLQSGRYRSEIEKDLEEGWRAGINSTPTFVINGKAFSGAAPLDKLETIIGNELEKKTNAG